MKRNRRVGIIVVLITALCMLLSSCRTKDTVSLFQPGVAYAASAAGVDPVVSLRSDKTAVSPSDTLTLTSVLSVPATETRMATGIIWKYQLPPGFVLVSARGPIIIENSATCTWDNPDGSVGSATSNIVRIVVNDKSLTLTPDANRVVSIPCGNLQPGEERSISLTLRYTGE